MDQEKDSLWAQVLTHKYINHRRSVGNRTSVGRIKGSSTIWIGIKEGEAVFKKGTKWIASQDSYLSFGTISGSIKELFESLLPALLIERKKTYTSNMSLNKADGTWGASPSLFLRF